MSYLMDKLVIHVHTHTDASNNSSRKPKLASGKKLRWSDGQESSDSQPFFSIKFELGANKSYLTWFLFTGFPSIGISSIMISGSIYHIFIMGIPALVKQHLYTEITAICMHMHCLDLKQNLPNSTEQGFSFSRWSGTSFTDINSLHAKFWRENINTYLHRMSLLHIDMRPILKILPSKTRTYIVYKVNIMAVDVLAT